MDRILAFSVVWTLCFSTFVTAIPFFFYPGAFALLLRVLVSIVVSEFDSINVVPSNWLARQSKHWILQST